MSHTTTYDVTSTSRPVHFGLRVLPPLVYVLWLVFWAGASQRSVHVDEQLSEPSFVHAQMALAVLAH